MISVNTKWRFTAHVRVDTDRIIEISGVFVGTHVQAYDHILRLASQHGGPIVRHEIQPFGVKATNVVRTTPVPQLPPPPTKEEASEQVAWFVTVTHTLKTQEFSGHGKTK